MKVQLFIPCTIDQFMPELGFKMIRVLERAGCSVTYEPRQTCCGKFFYLSGHQQITEKTIAKFVDLFFLGGLVVSPSTSCVQFIIEKIYGLTSSNIVKPSARKISENIFDITNFLVDVVKFTDLGSEFNASAVLIDDAAALNGAQERNTTYALLKNVRGLDLMPLPVPFRYYSLDPVFAKHQTELVNERDNRLLEAIGRINGVEKIIFTEPEHLLHFKSLFDKINAPYEAIHILDVLAA